VRVTASAVDEMIANLDQKLSTQVDVILHNKEFQQLESAWTSLKFLVDRTDFRENIKVEVMNVTKTDLLDDFEDAPEITKSGLYKLAYTQEYGQFGGKPYGLMVGNFEFGPSARTSSSCRTWQAWRMSHAPLWRRRRQFFGIDSFTGLRT